MYVSRLFGRSNGTYNIRKSFLNPYLRIQSSEFDSRFDEPTYLTFKVNFYSDEILTDYMPYDALPQALLEIPNYFNFNDADTDVKLYEYIRNYAGDGTTRENFVTKDGKTIRETVQNQASKFKPSGFHESRLYSAIDYLLNRNEDYRAFLLAKFILGLNELQEQYQFYFQSVSGLDELFKSTPDKGMKISKDAVITFECLEGIDQKIKYLMSLYRSAAWDDEYQRWILPDIYRFFKMDILISEIRTFHRSSLVKDDGTTSSFSSLVKSKSEKYLNEAISVASSAAADLLNKTLKGGDALKGNLEVNLNTLSVLENICPVTCIHCEMCDFDVNSNLYNNNYTINNSDAEKTTFKVHVKKAEVIYNWTTLSRAFGNLVDKVDRAPNIIDGKWDSPLAYQKDYQLKDSFFNNVIRMNPEEKHTDSTKYLLGGWGGNLVNGIVNTITNPNKSDNALDFAADIYKNIGGGVDGLLDSVFGKGLSAASDLLHGKKPDVTLKDLNWKNSVFGMNDGLDLGKYGTSYANRYDEHPEEKNTKSPTLNPEIFKNLTEKDRSWATDLDDDDVHSSEREMFKRELVANTMMYVGEMYNEKTGKFEPRSEEAKTAMEFIQNFKTQFQDLTENQQKILEEILEEKRQTLTMTNDVLKGNNPSDEMIDVILSGNNGSTKPIHTGLQTEDDRSLATDLDGGPDGDLTGIIESDYNPEMYSADLIDRGYNPEMQGVNLQSEDDRSWATDLDGGPDGDLTGLIDRDYNPEMVDVKLQSEPDRSWATDLDGGPDGTLTGLIDRDYNPEMVEANLQTEPDRSWATDLDGGPYGSMTGLIDREYNPELHASELQSEPDRSWATDLDGGPNGTFSDLIDRDYIPELHAAELQTVDDRSLATDLDGGPNGKLTGLIDRDYTAYLQNPEMQSEIDRSWATDLDGGPNGKLTGLIDRNYNVQMTNPEMQSEIDRSWATDLDGGPNGTMTKMNDNAYQPNEMIPNSIILENSYAESNSINLLENKLLSDNSEKRSTIQMSLNGNDSKNQTMILETSKKEIDRSWATDLDGGPMEMQNTSLFERIAQSQATSRDTIQFESVMQQTPNEQKPTKILLDNGHINPTSTVGEIIQYYSELKTEEPVKEIQNPFGPEGPTSRERNQSEMVSMQKEENKNVKTVL